MVYGHSAHSWSMTALKEIISEVRGALGVGVEVLTGPTMLVQLLPTTTTTYLWIWVS
jgi:type II secretory pathway predicted ATPase ExeA